MSDTTKTVRIEVDSEADTTGLNQAVSSIGAMRASITSVTSSMMMMDRMQYMNMRTQEMHEVATNRVENAQARYNDTVAKYGASSKEAVAAHNNLMNAQIMLQRSTQMMNYEHQMFVLRTVPMMLSAVMEMVTAFENLAEVEALSQGIVGVIQLGAAVAMLGTTAYMMKEAIGSPTYSNVSSPGGMPAMHSGGVVPSSGPYMLQAGETVDAGPARGGAGGDTINIQVAASGNVQELAHQIFEAVEREKRRKYPTNTRLF